MISEVHTRRGPGSTGLSCYYCSTRVTLQGRHLDQRYFEIPRLANPLSASQVSASAVRFTLAKSGSDEWASVRGEKGSRGEG